MLARDEAPLAGKRGTGKANGRQWTAEGKSLSELRTVNPSGVVQWLLPLVVENVHCQEKKCSGDLQVSK